MREWIAIIASGGLGGSAGTLFAGSTRLSLVTHLAEVLL